MVIIGIDPGTATTGYGVVDYTAGRLTHREHGTIRTPAGASPAKRLQFIHEAAAELIEAHAPAVIAVEQLFFSRNTTSALAVGQARGVILLAAAQRGVDVVEYTPMQVKLAVTGEGGAGKAQVAFMVRALLSLDQTPRPDDAADALAIAVCHAHSETAAARLGQVLRREGAR